MTVTAQPARLLHVWEILAGMHRIATGEELTADEFRFYLADPSALFKFVESTGAYDDPIKRQALEDLKVKLAAMLSRSETDRGFDGL